MENLKSKPAETKTNDMGEAIKKAIDVNMEDTIGGVKQRESNGDPSQMKSLADLAQAQSRPEFKMPEVAHIPTPIETLEKLIQHYKKDGVYADAVAHLETAHYKINNINQK